MCMYRQGMVCKWKLCKCAEKEKRFVKVFVNVYVLHGSFA